MLQVNFTLLKVMAMFVFEVNILLLSKDAKGDLSGDIFTAAE